MKRLLPLLLVCLLALAGCGPDMEAYYQQAQLYLGAGDETTAARLFDQLGEYGDSADYAAYCRALAALDAGDYALARAGFAALGGFKSSERYAAYAEAMMAAPQEALVVFETLGTFADSAAQAEALRTLMPEEAARQARLLMSHCRWWEALETLAPYGGQEVPDELADACREALYLEAERHVTDAALDEAAALMETYARLGTYRDSEARLAELTARFSVPLALTTHAAEGPYVQWSSYARGESGAEQPILWRAVKAEGVTVTLLSEYVLDRPPLATPSDLAQARIPAAMDLTYLTPDRRSACATAYAAAQGVSIGAEGYAPWLLAEHTGLGNALMVGADGRVAAADGALQPGVRLALEIPVERLNLSSGSGTLTDPYR